MKVTVYLISSFLLIYSNFTYTAEVFYCSEEQSAGWVLDKDTRKQIQGNFKLARFSISFTDKTYSDLVINDPHSKKKVSYECRDEADYDDRRINLYCLESTTTGPYTFLLSIKKRNFTWFKGSLYGHPTGGADSTYVSIGVCENF